MSIYDVSKRFEKEILLASDNLLISFPMYTEKDELIFFYQTKMIDEKNIIIKYIDKVVYRNRQNGETKSIDFEELIRNGVNLDLEIPFKIKPRVDFLSIENEFYDLHEKVENFIFLVRINENQKSLLVNYVNCFYQLVPVGSLRNVYFYLAKDFFNYIIQNKIS